MKTTDKTKKANKSPEANLGFFTVEDVAKMLRKKCTKSILRRIDAGKIVAKWDGGQYRR